MIITVTMVNDPIKNVLPQKNIVVIEAEIHLQSMIVMQAEEVIAAVVIVHPNIKTDFVIESDKIRLIITYH